MMKILRIPKLAMAQNLSRRISITMLPFFLLYSIYIIYFNLNTDFSDTLDHFALHQPTSPAIHQYCIRWCRVNQTDTTNITGIRLYPDLALPKAIQASNLFPYGYQGGSGPGQKAGEESIGWKCCHVCTEDCFNVLVDNTKSNTPETDVTMVTLFDKSRLRAFDSLTRRWKGPLIALFVINDFNDTPRTKLHAELAIDRIKKMYQDQANLKLLVYHLKLSSSQNTVDGFNQIIVKGKRIPLIPLNSFRNVLLDQVKSQFVFLIDVDFIPSKGLYHHIVENVKHLSQYDKSAFIVPHFQFSVCAFASKTKQKIPSDFQRIYSNLKRGSIVPFHSKTYLHDFPPHIVHFTPKASGCGSDNISEKHLNPRGVNLTDYSTWARESREINGNLWFQIPSSSTQGRTDFERWEPYIITNMKTSEGNLHRFNELFVGRFLNKVQWISSLRQKGYTFYTMNRHFLVHRPHRPSPFASSLKQQIPDHRNLLATALWAEVNCINTKSCTI